MFTFARADENQAEMWRAYHEGKDILAEIETDKATMELESPDDGIIQKIIVVYQNGLELKVTVTNLV